MAANDNYNQLVDRYIACWNERDPEIRSKLVEEVWADDCTYYNRLFVAQGRELMDFVIGRAHEEYYAKGFSFRSQSNAYGHHGGMQFNWVMISTATGEVDTWGYDFVMLNDEGKIRLDYQFNFKRPSV
ncbi:MAG: nuclear transport factor 2 family protein [Frankiaceae bacterium]